MRPSRAIAAGVSVIMLLVVCAMPRAQATTAAQTSGEPLDVVQLRPNFHVIAGAGGNIAVQTGSNGVLLVDYTNVLRRRGMALREAVVLAARTRLRPILMTLSLIHI